MSDSLPPALDRAWAFRASLVARGYADDEIAVDAGPTLHGVTGPGAVETAAANEPSLAICVTVTRGGRAWSVPLAPWPLDASLVRPLWDALRAAVERGAIDDAQIEAAIAAHPFDAAWMTTELEARGMPSSAQDAP